MTIEAAPTVMGTTLRRYLNVATTRPGPELVGQIYAAGFVMHTAGRDLPLETYLVEKCAYLESEPTVGVAITDVITTDAFAAVALHKWTRDPTPTSWDGLALFRFEGSRLAESWTEQDWLSRKEPDNPQSVPALPYEGPVWERSFQPPDADVERLVGDWLGGGLPDGPAVRLNGQLQRTASWPLVTPDSVRINLLFSSGSRFAFHASLSGSYQGGLRDLDRAIGRSSQLEVAGMGETRGGAIVEVNLAPDRRGVLYQLRSSVLAAAPRDR